VIFASDLTKDQAKVDMAKSADGIYDLLAVVKQAQRVYDAGGKHDKAHKWLLKFSKRVSHYGNIMDVLCQHNPEYVSLAWGAMKFLFTVRLPTTVIMGLDCNVAEVQLKTRWMAHHEYLASVSGDPLWSDLSC
jgi:hypothetical protein